MSNNLSTWFSVLHDSAAEKHQFLQETSKPTICIDSLSSFSANDGFSGIYLFTIIRFSCFKSEFPKRFLKNPNFSEDFAED